MNELFVNIKVDREERPDLDKIYQFAHQVLTQRGGGWPLTMFLTPRRPETVLRRHLFPDEARYGMPAFTDLLRRVAEFYRAAARGIARTERHADGRLQRSDARARRRGRARRRAARRARASSSRPTFDKQLRRLRRRAEVSASRHRSTACMRHWHATRGDAAPDLQALYMATLTLTRMAEGGLYDQLGGGFARYSVDQFWMIPHFEKMLYDNGALLRDLCRRRARHRRRAVPAHRRAKPATGCCATCRTPRRAAASTRPRRRLRRPRGQVLRVDRARRCSAR